MAASRVAACALPVKRTLYNTTVYAKLFTVKYRMSVKLPVPFSLNTHTHRPHTHTRVSGCTCTKRCMCAVCAIASAVSCAGRCAHNVAR